MYSLEQKWKRKEQTKEIVSQWRQENSTIVFTNGCFDILHFGHIRYLEQARELGDKLVIGLNSDSSVRRLKGSDRPINGEMARAALLSALECVDLVIPFQDDTPAALIRWVRPDVLVKGGDYSKDDIVGAGFVESSGGIVCIIPFVEGYSTSAIINKMNAGK